jgi:ferredoxin
MEIEIYYFSTTGNSLVIARDIAQKTKGKLISIPSTNNLRIIKSKADIIGIIFPVYYATFGEKGFPYLVEKFINKMENIDNKYIFAICTHSGYPGFTIENLNQLLIKRKGKLSAGLNIRAGYPFSTIEKIKHIIFNKPLSINIEKEKIERERLRDKYIIKTEALCEAIKRKKEFNINKTSIIIKYIKQFLLNTQKRMAIARYQKLSSLQANDFRQLVHSADNSFAALSRCNACGVCQKVCPVDNIIIVDKKPKWLNKCENCYACYQWCPQEAITGKIVEFEKRYHQPYVKIGDILITEQ